MVHNLVKTRLPTAFGDFMLSLYDEDGKEHLALVKGDVRGQSNVPVRVHSECLTGDVFGSRRCDCGDQLKHTQQYLGRQAVGILIYLRQEGRGIGLSKKMEAYNLQDQGLDTVEANIELGHQPDERDYGIAAKILNELGVKTIRLITNNPHKIEALEAYGVKIASRIPIEVGHHAENLGYLRSKAERMSHQLKFRERHPEGQALAFIEPLVDQLLLARHADQGHPFVTLTYAQSMDGSIAVDAGIPFPLSSEKSLALTHYLRSQHDALLVGVNTLLADDPQLNVRYCAGEDPRPVILDSHLRTPPGCRLLKGSTKSPVILTTMASASAQREALTHSGAEVIVVKADADGGVDLHAALDVLFKLGIRTLMVEGGGKIISTFLKQRLVNYCVITITPKIIGGFKAIEGPLSPSGIPLTITGCRYESLGSDLIAFGALEYAP